MLVQYNGERVMETRSSGCSKCGTGRSISGTETFKNEYRTYYGNRFYIFTKEVPVEVDDLLGKWLLTQTYQDKDGTIKHSFTEVPKV